MSGGEPSSIKRRFPSAAASLHLYAKQRSALSVLLQKGEVCAMYRALYRKWRPRRFADVVGQTAIVTALQNQIAAGRIGHAYLFTGTRGTGKTTCAKIFAKAVNCPHSVQGDPCCECEICRGIDDGSILDVVEMDAASNNGVDDVRAIRDETNYTPSQGRKKVYIIDEVHMLSGPAFNALLKTLEEPPSHVVFILATTEIQKVPATILSRCQRYDFGRIRPQDIAERVLYIAGQEGIELTPAAAGLIARLADGALRDALSILDTCAGSSNHVDEETVRRMAGVTDKSYLFRLSDALQQGRSVAALAELAELRQQSVDMKRLCEEMIAHYRNLMLAALPGGQELLGGVSPEEEPQYLEKARTIPQSQSIRAIRRLGEALEKMGRGTDQRVELELALFALSQPEEAPVPSAVQQAAAQPTVQPFVSAPAAPQPFMAAPRPAAAPAPAAAPSQPEPEPAAPPQPEPAPTVPWEAEPVQPAQNAAPIHLPSTPAAAPAPAPAQKQPQARPQSASQHPPEPFAQWPLVLEELEQRDKMLISFLKGTHAFYDGKRVLIECSDLFRDFIRTNKDSQELIKTVIAEKTGIRCGIGPYTPKGQAKQTPALQSADATLQALSAMGVPVIVQEKE